VPSPGREQLRYGGNTSCVHVTLSDGTHLILDAGTGIRGLPVELGTSGAHIHILLTHLHLDHIQGLMFFAPLFDPQARVTIWGPSAPGVSLKNRIARYLSAPLTPIDVRELPCDLDFRNCPISEWEIGSARLRAEAVTHRGPTLGFRIEDADATICYLPDHEPELLGSIENLEPEWISGFALAHNADLLIHDCQYTDVEYPEHFGWGHSAVSSAVRFAERCDAARALLFHHDPAHTDADLDLALVDALDRWTRTGRGAETMMMASEGEELTVSASAPRSRALV
jgi:ribonuclease BN (tRNA processing enzyme)